MSLLAFDPGAITFGRLVWPFLAGLGLALLLTADWQPLGRPRPDLAERLRRADPDAWARREQERRAAPSVVHWRPLDALLRPLLDDAGGLVQRLLAPLGLAGHAALERELARSQPGMTAQRWWGDKLLTALALGGAWPVLDHLDGAGVQLHPAGGWPVWLWLLGAIGGFVWPDLRLRAARERRQERLVAELVPLLDALTLAISAGLGLEQALLETAQELGGELGAELQRASREAALGQRELGAALAAMAARLDVPELGRLVDGLRAALDQGLPLAATLGVQAEALREAERLRLLARGGQRTVLLLVPVALTVFPVMLAVVMYPAGRLVFGLGG